VSQKRKTGYKASRAGENQFQGKKGEQCAGNLVKKNLEARGARRPLWYKSKTAEMGQGRLGGEVPAMVGLKDKYHEMGALMHSI